MEKVLGMLEMVLEERKRRKMAFFLSYLDYKAQNVQVSNALGNGNFVHTPYISKIPTVRSWTSVL